MVLKKVCHVEELDHDQPRCYRVEGRDLLVIRHWDKIYALENRCGHMGAALHKGDYTDGLLVCPLHGAAYRVENGEVEWPAVIPPPMSDYKHSDNARLRQFGKLIEEIETLPIKAFKVRVIDEEVFIEK